MKNSPFQTTKKKLEIVSVGDAETGVIYLAKRNGITPNENPVDMQESMQRQTAATLIFLQAVKNCAEKEGISRAEARELIFPSPKPPAVAPTTETSATSAIVVAEKPKSADLYDYLEPEQAAKLISLQEDSRHVALQAATLFLQHRLAYPIVVTADAKAKSNLLEIEPLRFQVASGNRFKLDDTVIEVAEAASYEVESLVLEPLSQKVVTGTVGFLLDVTGREKLGDPEWTHEHTRSYLTEAQIEAIYRFYQEEIGIASKSDESATEGNSTTISPDLLNINIENLSTGAISTGESKVTESEMNGSTPKTLEVSPIG